MAGVQVRQQRIRIACDVTSRNPQPDKITGGQPIFCAGNDIVFELAFFAGDPSLGILVDTSVISTLTLTLKPKSNIDGASVMTKIVSHMDTGVFNDAMTLVDWQNDNPVSGYQVAVAFDMTMTGLSPADYWMVVSILTNDMPSRKVTYLENFVTVKDDGTNPTTSPLPAPPTSYTKQESDLRYVAVGSGNIYNNPDNGKNYVLIVRGTGAPGDPIAFEPAEYTP